MAALANAVELFMHIFSKDASKKAVCEQSSINAGIGFMYCTFMFAWLVVWTKYSDKSFSAILTAAAAVQLMGFVILSVKIRGFKSCAGISSKSIELYMVFFLLRLPSTVWMNGYIPVDRSGRFVYQALDVCTFFVLVQLLYCLHSSHKDTYQKHADTMPSLPLLPPCAILAWFIHANLNRSPFFDTLWAASTYVDTIAMLPQLWLMSQIGGQVHACTSHFIACIVASRIMSVMFWFRAYKDLELDGSALAGKAIIIAHVIQLILAADFMYFYVKARLGGKGIRLPVGPQTDSSASAMDI